MWLSIHRKNFGSYVRAPSSTDFPVLLINQHNISAGTNLGCGMLQAINLSTNSGCMWANVLKLKQREKDLSK